MRVKQNMQIKILTPHNVRFKDLLEQPEKNFKIKRFILKFTYIFFVFVRTVGGGMRSSTPNK